VEAGRIAIVGGGIGGLSAALSLQHFGFKVDVYERSAAAGEVGAGVMITPNGMHALDALGIGDELVACSNRCTSLTVHSFAGDITQVIPPGISFKETLGAERLQVHRADLHMLLLKAITANDKHCVHFGHDCIALHQSASEVVLNFANGATSRADIAIVCDGGASRLRDLIFGAEPVKFTGDGVFRALLPAELVPPGAAEHPTSMYVGPGRMFLHYFLRHDSVLNIVAYKRQTDWVEDGWAIPGDKTEFIEGFKDFDPNVGKIIQAIPAESIFKWGLRDRRPLQNWFKGRVAMLGDAAHLISPFIGQGAVMAIEDAFILGRCMHASNNHTAAFMRYEAARKDRVVSVFDAATENAKAQLGQDGRAPSAGIP